MWARALWRLFLCSSLLFNPVTQAVTRLGHGAPISEGPWLSLVSANFQGKEEEQDPDMRFPKVGPFSTPTNLPISFLESRTLLVLRKIKGQVLAPFEGCEGEEVPQHVEWP